MIVLSSKPQIQQNQKHASCITNLGARETEADKIFCPRPGIYRSLGRTQKQNKKLALPTLRFGQQSEVYRLPWKSRKMSQGIMSKTETPHRRELMTFCRFMTFLGLFLISALYFLPAETMFIEKSRRAGDQSGDCVGVMRSCVTGLRILYFTSLSSSTMQPGLNKFGYSSF